MIENVQKIIVKLIPQPTPDAGAIKGEDVAAAFNRWIQKGAISGHHLIDAANYSHVHDGPGVVLAGLEANFHLENASTGRRFAYQRKTPLEGDLTARLRAILEITRNAGTLLEKELPIRFRADQFEVLFADRLLAQATEETFEEMAAALAPFAKSVGTQVEVVRNKESLARAIFKGA